MKAPDATYVSRDGAFVLRYERRLDHPVDRVWAALTEPDELAGWLAAAMLEPSVGGEVMLHWLNTDDEGNEAILHGVITGWTPPELLEYATDIHGLMRWELRADGDGTALTFVNENDHSADHLLLVLAGWHIHLDHLEDALDGTPVDWSTWSPATRARGSGLSWNDHWQRYSDRGRRRG